MRDFVPWTKQYWYPHQREFEIGLIERFIEKFPDRYDKVAYSFPVGVPPPFNPIVNDATGGSLEYDYQRKIDIVGEKNGKCEIVEAKKKAGISTIGQVQGYADLYFRDEKPSTYPKCVIICNSTDNDTLHVAQNKGVEIIVL